MKDRVNPKWQVEIDSKLLQDQSLDVTLSYLPAVQWLITKLSRFGKPYKLYNLGAGVRRITTETDICPCCKQRIK